MLRDRRTLLVIAVVIVAVLATTAAVFWAYPMITRPSGPSYSAITVTNNVTVKTIHWVLSNAGFIVLGAYSLSTQIVLDSTGRISTLSLYFQIVGYHINLTETMWYYFTIQVNGSISPGLVPSGVSIGISNTFNGTLPAILLVLGPSGISQPDNITSYPSGFETSDAVFSGWGNAVASFGLANESRVGNSTFFFALPGSGDTHYADPPNGSLVETDFDIVASLEGLGQPVYCGLTVAVETTIPS